MDKIVELFKEDYALALGSMKWISKGGELLRYSGQSVLLVKFIKDSKESPWKTSTVMVDLIGISDYEPVTGTYLATWKEEGQEEVHSERITPEGFSFNLPEEDLWMNRLLPLSLHIKITEATRSYSRFEKLWKERDSMSIDNIRKYYLKKQKETTAYKNYISLIVNTNVEDGLGVGITECRIIYFGDPQSSGKYWSVGIRDYKENFYVLRIPKGEESEAFSFTVNGVFIGKAKIIDLQG